MEPRLQAAIHGPTSIRLTLTGADRPDDPGAWRLTDGGGREIPVAQVLRQTETGSLLIPCESLDIRRVHYLEVPALSLRTLVRRDPWFRNLYSTRALGAEVGEDGVSTTFRVFSPRADAVRLHLYGVDGRTIPEPDTTVDMVLGADGVWEAHLTGDLHRTWYDFTVHGPPDPGNWFFETHPVHISDPYARVNDDALGRSRVWRDGPPPPPVTGGRPAMEDVVAYEVHLQDFTDLLPEVGAEAGTLPAMARAGLRNADGEPVGFDHLVALGVNVVHLMPMQEYLHYSDEEWRATFADDPVAREMGIAEENYQWGYRTTHAFAVESRFRPPASEHGAERQAFKDLVAAFHARGMAVIIDVVPNHTGENMDGRHLLLNFNVLDLPYWFRTNDDLEHIGPFGNEVKSEERPMVQRWIVDQLRHWVEELGVDGFRIDLAGQIDRQTLLRVKRVLPADLIIYGEPWIAPSDPDVASNPDWSWYKADAPITFFQDDARNAFQGSPFDVKERGWAGGDGTARDAAVRALANRFDEEPLSTRGISYLDIHDNWTLADRYATDAEHDGRRGVDLGAVRRAAGLLLTSAGPVVIHGGTEMLRTKGLAPDDERVVETAGGPIHFKGRDDTYNLRAPNRFVWSDLVPGSAAVAMRDWWRGLLSLRFSEAGRVFRVAEVPDDHYRFFLPDDGRLLAYLVGDEVLVVANNGDADGAVEVELPPGAWRQVAGLEAIDLAGIDGPQATLRGGPRTVDVAAEAFLIWIREPSP